MRLFLVSWPLPPMQLISKKCSQTCSTKVLSHVQALRGTNTSLWLRVGSPPKKFRTTRRSLGKSNNWNDNPYQPKTPFLVQTSLTLLRSKAQQHSHQPRPLAYLTLSSHSSSVLSPKHVRPRFSRPLFPKRWGSSRHPPRILPATAADILPQPPVPADGAHARELRGRACRVVRSDHGGTRAAADPVSKI